MESKGISGLLPPVQVIVVLMSRYNHTRTVISGLLFIYLLFTLKILLTVSSLVIILIELSSVGVTSFKGEKNASPNIIWSSYVTKS